MQESAISGTVLVVDDQEVLLSVAEDMLTARGLQVLLANSGPQALSLFKENQETVDVVLLDLKMPDMDGHEVFTKLRAISPAIPVIITSGFSQDETQDYFENFDLDNITYLQKPYRFRSLTETVKAVLQQAK